MTYHLILLIFGIVLAISSLIRHTIYKRKFIKEHHICPECGEELNYEIFDIETGGISIGGRHFSHGVKYYPVMTCPKCYYTIKLYED